MLIVRIVVFLLGLAITLGTLSSAIKSTVLPGRKKVRLARFVFRNTFRLFRLASRRARGAVLRGEILDLYAPISIMLLPLTWVVLLIIGNSAMFWAVGAASLGRGLTLSGAALTTEGFFAPQGTFETILYIVAGIVGLAIVGLLITFLPTSYSIYAQREQEVTRVSFRFGTPPSGVKVIEQAYRSGLAQDLDELWHGWEEWFTAMYESHLSNMQVIFYRSSQPGTSWVTTAGAILDACALFSSTVDRQDEPWLKLCFQAGCHTLVDIAAVVHSIADMELAPGEVLHVTQAEFEIACEQLSDAEVPLKADRGASWLAFVVLRSQYDAALLSLAQLVYAPPAPWSSDRRPQRVKRKRSA
jgi:hypothetical protein